MPICLITIRPSQNDHMLLEDYLILFKSWLQTYKYVECYSWSIEEDNTINRHLHCYLEHSENKGCGKIKEQLKTTIFKTFIKTLPHTTIADIMINVVNSVDPKAHLGYASKDHTCRHEATVSDEDIISALKYYYTTEKYKTRILEKAGSSNWKHVTSRNFHVIVEDYLKKNPELSLEDSHELILSMKSNFYTFQLPIRDNDKFFKELKLSHKLATREEKNQASMEAISPDFVDEQNTADIKKLLEFIWKNTRLCGACCVLQESALKQNDIMYIFKKHQHLFDNDVASWPGNHPETEYIGLCETP